MTGQILALREHLLEHNVTCMVMEATALTRDRARQVQTRNEIDTEIVALVDRRHDERRGTMLSTTHDLLSRSPGRTITNN